jgi:dihydroorotate dehydrogenase (fumarate)
LEFILGQTTYHNAEGLSYFPNFEGYNVGPGEYLELVYQASRTVDVPIIASLNGITERGWIDYAKDIVDSGASALELNLFFLPVNIHISGAEVEDQYVRVVEAVRDAVSVPIAVKLSPYFSSTGHFAQRLVSAGATGLVLFNRLYQPDFNLETRTVESRLELSTPSEIRLPLLWIAVLYGQLKASLAGSTGVETADEALKYILAGADAVYTTSALLRHGPTHLKTILNDIKDWMKENEIDSVGQIKGSMSLKDCAEPEAFVRANYIKMLQSVKG